MRRCPRGQGRSVDRGRCGSGIQPRNRCPRAQARGLSGCRRSGEMRKARPGASPRPDARGPRAVRDPEHVPNHLARKPGGLALVCGEGLHRPHREVQGRTPMMHGREKSDGVVVPEKLPNKTERSVAEAVEGRAPAKGNSQERNALRTQRRVSAQSALERVREAAKKDRKQRFTALVEEGEVGARRGHSELFRCDEARVDREVPRAPDCG